MENKKKNIIVAASGTGGHIYPGIALASELRAKGYEPVFFVSNNEASAEIIKNSGFESVRFNLSGMPRKLSFSFFTFFVKLVCSFFRALKYVLEIKPLAVIGVGGYVSVPAVLAGKVCGIKTFIHEQNTVPGIANRFLNRFAGKTLISFEDSVKYFRNKKKIVFTGYPVRKEILTVCKDDGCDMLRLDKHMFTVMVFGGSLGAVKLNETSFEALMLLSKKMKMQVIHITGKKGYEDIKNKAKDLPDYKVFDYMHNISGAYAASDMLICRAGAGTVFELKSLKKPAVLVPYPYATDNHQLYNAQEAARGGNVIIIEERELTPEKLAAAVEKIKESIKVSESGVFSKLPQEIITEEIIKDIKG